MRCMGICIKWVLQGGGVLTSHKRHGGDKGLSFAFPHDGNIRNTSKHCITRTKSWYRYYYFRISVQLHRCFDDLNLNHLQPTQPLSSLFSHKTMPSNRSDRPSANISFLETKALDDRWKDWWCWKRPWSKRFVSYCRWIKTKFHDSPTLPRPCFRNDSTTRIEV